MENQLPENSGIQKFLRSEASFYISLVASVVIITASVVGTYFATTGKFALLDQKISFYVENTQKDSVAQLDKIRAAEDKISGLEGRLTATEKEVITLRSLFTSLQK